MSREDEETRESEKYKMVVTQSRMANSANVVSYLDSGEISVTIDFNDFITEMKKRINSVALTFTKTQLDNFIADCEAAK